MNRQTRITGPFVLEFDVWTTHLWLFAHGSSVNKSLFPSDKISIYYDRQCVSFNYNAISLSLLMA